MGTSFRGSSSEVMYPKGYVEVLHTSTNFHIPRTPIIPAHYMFIKKGLHFYCLSKGIGNLGVFAGSVALTLSYLTKAENSIGKLGKKRQYLNVK